MALTQFPEPKPLDILEIGAKNVEAQMDEQLNINKYSVSNPHPGYGKDPNIINELGHTLYPKWIKNKDGVDVVVQNAQEEAEVTGNEIEKPKTPKPANPWK